MPTLKNSENNDYHSRLVNRESEKQLLINNDEKIEQFIAEDEEKDLYERFNILSLNMAFPQFSQESSQERHDLDKLMNSIARSRFKLDENTYLNKQKKTDISSRVKFHTNASDNSIKIFNRLPLLERIANANELLKQPKDDLLYRLSKNSKSKIVSLRHINSNIKRSLLFFSLLNFNRKETFRI
jgi:hypothetical protein